MKDHQEIFLIHLIIKNKEKIITEIKNNSENNGPVNSNNGKKTRPYPKKKSGKFIFKFIDNAVLSIIIYIIINFKYN